VNVSDHEYVVEQSKRNRPEIPRRGGGKKKENACPIKNPHLFIGENNLIFD